MAPHEDLGGRGRMPRRNYRRLGYAAEGEEEPTRLALILFFWFVCAAVVAMAWFARGA
jgi:hypothetical protein